MRILLPLIAITVILSSCTWGAKPSTPTETLYPSVPLGSTGEIQVPVTQSGYSFTAKGTEPFWSVEVTPTSSTISRPTEKEVVTENYSTVQDDKGAMIIVRSVKGDFFVNLTKGECSDGMSDVKYEYSATVLVGADSLKGCANKK